jgi:hypothetical protein
MAADEEHAGERTHLLYPDRRLDVIRHDGDVASTISSHISKEEQLLGETAIGERLPYNDYTTIDWLHDLVRISIMLLEVLELTMTRSRTRIAIGQFTRQEVFVNALPPVGTHVRGG